MLAQFPFLTLVLIAALAVAPLAHAGNVVSKLSGGKLTLTGDDTPNDLTIDQVGVPADSLRVTPGAGTTIDGNVTPQVFAGSTGGLKVILGNQDDRVLLEGAVLAGKLEIKAGGGRDDVGIDTTTAGATKIDLGAGPNALAVCTSQLNGKLTVKGGVSGPLLTGIPPLCPSVPDIAVDLPGNLVRVQGSVVAGDLAIAGADGFDLAYVYGSDVGGKLKIASGAGRGFALMCDVDVAKDATIALDVGTGGGDFTYACLFPGDGAAAVVSNSSSVVLGRAKIGGKLAVNPGSGGVALCDVTTRKDLLLKFAAPGAIATAECLVQDVVPLTLTQALSGTGSPAVLLGVQVGGKIDAKFAATPTSVHRFAVGYVTVAKALKATFAAGAGFVFGNTVTAESLVVKGGGGNDDVGISAATFTKKGTVDLAGGANTVTIGTTTFGGDLLVKTGDGNDTIDVAGATVLGKRTVKSGAGTDTVQQ